eukprot:15450100-Alexandrium_andersonii.AAC.1
MSGKRLPASWTKPRSQPRQRAAGSAPGPGVRQQLSTPSLSTQPWGCTRAKFSARGVGPRVNRGEKGSNKG